MPEKPIYISIGNGNFSLWNGGRRRLRVSGKSDPVRMASDARVDRRFAEDEHLLRHNDKCEADMISLEEPDEAM